MIIQTKVVAVFLLFSLASCVHISSPNIAEGDNITANEAILLTKVHGAMIPAQIFVHNMDDGLIALAIARLAVTTDGQILAVKIRSGEHLRISQYFSLRGKAYFGDDSFNFTIRPGTITYIGDFFVEENGFSVFIKVKDLETSTVQAAKNSFPLLFSKLPSAKSLAGGQIFSQRKKHENESPPNKPLEPTP